VSKPTNQICVHTNWLSLCDACDTQNDTQFFRVGAGVLLIGNGEEIMQKIVPLPKAEPKKNGQVRKLPRSSSPLFTTQWSAQGSARLPYVISHRENAINGAVTDEGWACSCPDFTRHTPRADCKHICWVKKSEHIELTAAPVALLPKAQREAFNKFLLQQATAGTPALPAGKSKPFITQGRKFR
jgi:hypothetical protein